MIQKAVLAGLCLSMGLTIASCCSLCPSASSARAKQSLGGPEIHPTPGNNCSLGVLPVPGSGQPSMWVAYDFENSNVGGTTNTIKLGSEQVDLSVGGQRTIAGDPYFLKVTGLTTANPTAKLIDQNLNEQNVNVTPITSSGNALPAFSSYVWATDPPSDKLFLNMMAQDKGVQVEVTAWPGP